MVRFWSRLVLLVVGLAGPAVAASPTKPSDARAPDAQAPVVPLLVGPASEPRGPVKEPPPTPPAEQPLVQALRLYAPPDCVSLEVIAKTVESWIGVNTLPITWAVVIKVHGQQSEFSIFEVGRLVALRRFDGLRGGCRDAQAVLGAALGLSLEALIERRRDQAPSTVPGPAPDTPLPQAPVQPPTPSVTAHGSFAVGILLEPAWGAGISMALPEGAHTWSRFGVLGLVAEDAHVTLDELDEARIASRLVALHVGQCLSDSGERLRTSACLDVLGGPVSVVGSGVVQPQDAILPSLAIGLGASTRFRIYGPLALTLAGALEVNLVRPILNLTDTSGRVVESRQVSAAGFMAHAGVTWVYR